MNKTPQKNMLEIITIRLSNETMFRFHNGMWKLRKVDMMTPYRT